MGKVINVEEALKKQLKKPTACYVLVSCSPPDKDGKMEVEMNYEGDEMLAAFLVENAMQVFETRLEKRESK